MHQRWKLIAIFVAVGSVFSPIWADGCSYVIKSGDNASCEAWDCGTTDYMTCCGEIGASAGFRQDCSWGLYVTGEALYWQALQGGLEYALLDTNTGDGINDGKDYTTGNVWDWGSRVSLGYNATCDDWDWVAIYTRFHTSNDSLVSSGAALVQDILMSINQYINAFATWILRFDQIDLDVGRALYLGRCLAVRPHIGLRAIWVDDKQHVDYSGGINPVEDIDLECKFWGIGIKGGCGTNWGLCGGFSIYGDLSLAILQGYEDAHCSAFSAGALVTKTKDFYRIGKTNIDLMLGLQWDAILCKTMHLGLNVGWDLHMYPDIWQWLHTAITPTPSGDLVFNGVSFGGRLDF